jgi:uncharacterized protein YhaN
MRFLELCLRAFGHFSDWTLDLSGGAEGLHLIYGPNEAGKSTTRRAILALLYGFHERSTDDFRHGKPDLRVAARLRFADGAEFAFTRRKRRENTLWNFADAEPIPPADNPLSRCLRGIDENTFKTLFCLDHAELVSGSDNILRGQGNVGQALFSAGLGGANLRVILNNLDEETDKLFKRQGQNQLINAGLRQYREKREKIRAAALSGADWQQAEQELSQALARREELTAEHDAKQREKERLARLEQAHPLLARRRLSREQLALLGELPPLPEDFSRQRTEASAHLKAAAAEQARSEADLENVKARLAAVEVRDDVLAQEAAIRALHQEVGGFRADLTELPRLRDGLNLLEKGVAGMLAELYPGLTAESAERLRLTDLQRSLIRRLASEHAVLTAAEIDARKNLESLDNNLASRRLSLEKLPSAPDVAELSAALRRVQKRGDLEAALASERQAEAQAEENARALFAAMPPPWPQEARPGAGIRMEELDAVAWLHTPSNANITRFEREFSQLESQLERIKQELEQCEREIAIADRDLEASRLAGPLPTEEDLETSRAWRGWGWELVYAAWKANSAEPQTDHAGFIPEGHTLAEAFAASIAEADDVADRLRRESARIGQRASLQATLDACIHRGEQIRLRQSDAQRALEDLRARWVELWRPTGLAPLSPGEMRDWLSSHDQLRQAVLAARKGRETAARAAADLDAACEELLAAGGGALASSSTSPAPRLEALIDWAQARIKEATVLSNRREHLDQEIKTAETNGRPVVEKKRREAQAALEKWEREWAQALQPLKLERAIVPAEAENVLARLEGLFADLSRIDAHRREIAARQARVAVFSDEVCVILGRLTPDPQLAGLAPAAAAEQLNVLLNHAQNARTSRDGLEARRDESLLARDAALAKARAAGEILAEFCQLAGCESPKELEAVESRWRQGMAHRQTMANLEEQLLRLSAGQSLEALEKEAAAEDADALPGRIERLAAEIPILDRQIKQCVEDAARAKERLAQFDKQTGAARAAEDAEEILAKLRAQAFQYARLKLSSALLRREMERYRLENQNPLVRRAGELFAALTGGSFVGLCTDQEDGGQPVLRGLRPGHGSGTTPVDGMSEGTRDQLYLALRLASLEKTLAAQEPLPLILDDILINFDDGRVRQTLRALREFSAQTQVLLFIHHEHLLSVAREELGDEGFFAHRLPSR